jgi:predicted alpha/beta hydrolase
VSIRKRQLVFDARDGLRLAASIFEPVCLGNARATILITSATGVKRHFYDRFATFLAENGFVVMSFDYRGIGDSLPGTLRDFRGDIRDWGALDLVGAVAVLRSSYPTLPLLVVAHSVGGQILGFAQNSDQISGLLCVCAQHGHWGNWPLRHGLLFAGLCYFAMPALSHLVGYFPARFMGLGDDIPKGIALGWARWARDATYLNDVPFAPHNIPGRSYSFADDILAPETACDSLCVAYPGVMWERCHMHPRTFDVSKVGHFGFFRDRFKESLWAQSLCWLIATASRGESSGDTTALG